jgi:four helix bundle protein
MEEKKSKHPTDLCERTKQFAVRIIRLYSALPRANAVAGVIGKQLLRSGTSVGAQYREASRARSRAEFISKVECVLQELEETRYWFELLVEAKVVNESRLSDLMDEARQLTAILTASVKTTKRVREK